MELIDKKALLQALKVAYSQHKLASRKPADEDVATGILLAITEVMTQPVVATIEDGYSVKMIYAGKEAEQCD